MSKLQQGSQDCVHPSVQVRSRRFPLLLLILLGLTAAVSLVASHFYLLNGDDLLEIWGDNTQHITHLITNQRSFPLEIDPFFYHWLTFLGLKLFGLRPMLLRLPSLCGFLVTQVCLYYFVRRIASERAALLAALFPAITASLSYTWLVRPYALLLGLYAIAMLSWQTAARTRNNRVFPLAALALSIALALNTHYYAVLLLIPLFVAEAVRTISKRRVDVSMLISVGVGMMGWLFVLPFVKGASEFRANYSSYGVTYSVLAQSYNSILFGTSVFSVLTNHLLQALYLITACVALWMSFRQMLQRKLPLEASDLAFVVTLAMLPLFSFLVGHFVTHAFEPRYALGSLIGISSIIAISMAQPMRSSVVSATVLGLLSVYFVVAGILSIRNIDRQSQSALQSLRISPKVEAALLATPSQMLYIQDIDVFGFAQFHEENLALLPHLALIYSPEQEMLWNHIDLSSRLASHLERTHSYTILRYEQVLNQPGEHLFVVGRGGWNWIENALRAGHFIVQPVGSAFNFEIVSVTQPKPIPVAR